MFFICRTRRALTPASLVCPSRPQFQLKLSLLPSRFISPVGTAVELRQAGGLDSYATPLAQCRLIRTG